MATYMGVCARLYVCVCASMPACMHVCDMHHAVCIKLGNNKNDLLFEVCTNGRNRGETKDKMLRSLKLKIKNL